MTRARLLRVALSLAVGAAGAIAVFWLLLPASDESEVLAPVRELARAAAVDAGTPGPLGAARGARLAAFFTAEASVDLSPPFAPAVGRDALAAAAGGLSVPAGGLRITLLEADESVDRRLLLANATVTLRATSADGREVWGERTYDVALRQRDGVWLINDVRPAVRAR
ncbi:MAG: nuclear transport factor 2 family protein [Acidobacteria bacterium]|nr:nuclear transport factor 2 family protein [Acidobacteriota bacterium]